MDDRQRRALIERFDLIKKQCDRFVLRDAEISKVIQDILRRLNQREESDRLTAYKDILAHSVEGSSNYSNLIIVGGYAGGFAVWQLTREHLTRLESAAVGTSLLLSISLFAGFEVYKMIAAARLFGRLSKVLRDENIPDQIAAWHRLETWSHNRLADVWRYFLWPTVLTGFGAAAYLLFALLLIIWHEIS